MQNIPVVTPPAAADAAAVAAAAVAAGAAAAAAATAPAATTDAAKVHALDGERLEEDEEDEDEDEDDDDDEDEEEEDAAQTWIEWYCSIRSNAFLVEVDEDFITDDFNMTGLASEVPYYDHALDTILDSERAAEAMTEAQQETVDAAAELLYGLAHARFLLTARGLAAVLEKFNVAAYGRCPRVHCEGQAVLPVGTSDAPSKAAVALFCPRCNDIYHPKSAKMGAF